MVGQYCMKSSAFYLLCGEIKTHQPSGGQEPPVPRLDKHTPECYHNIQAGQEQATRAAELQRYDTQ